jgi:Dodecin
MPATYHLTHVELRRAEVSKLDMKVEDGEVVAYRARVSLSFEYDSEWGNSAAPAPQRIVYGPQTQTLRESRPLRWHHSG